MGADRQADHGRDLRAPAAGLVLTAPFTPMLFIGEEWGARTPRQYFTDHRDAASRGRLRIAANLGAVTREVPAEGADGPADALLAASAAGVKAGSSVIQLPPASFAVLLT